MNFFQKIISFIKNKLNLKKENLKLSENTEETHSKINSSKKNDFEKSLRVPMNKKKKNIDTLVCYGDGLGINDELKFF